MPDRTPTTEAGRRHVTAYTLPEELQAVLDIEDEARAPLVAALLHATMRRHNPLPDACDGCRAVRDEVAAALSREDRP